MKACLCRLFLFLTTRQTIMEESNQKNLNIAALIVLGFLFVASASQLMMHYQMNVLYTKPLFFSEALERYFDKIKENSLTCSIVGGIALVPALLFYFFKKPIIAIVIAMLALAYIQTRYSPNDVYELQKSTFLKHWNN